MPQIVARHRAYSGKVLDLSIEEHSMPDGRKSAFEVVRHPGGAAMLAVLPDQKLLLIRQFRPAVGKMIYEIPAGRLEPDESPDECAARELSEETGYHAAEILPLGSFWSTPGFCDEEIFLFLGRELAEVERQLEPDELIELCPMSLESALELIDRGEILDSKTVVAILQFQRRFMEHLS